MAVNTLTLYMPGSSVGIQVYEGSQLHLILVSQGANSIPSAPGETVRQDPFPQYVDNDELSAAVAAGMGASDNSVAALVGDSGSTTSAALEAAYARRHWADVRAYGATGNGTTDDRAAIQAALDDVAADGGGTVYVPAGTYRINGTLTAYGATTLVGENPRTATLKLANGVNVSLLVTPDDGQQRHGLAIRSLGFHGNAANQTTGTAPLIDVRGMNEPTLRDLYILEPRGPAIRFGQATPGVYCTVPILDGLVIRGDSVNSHSAGIFFDSGSSDAIVSNCDIGFFGAGAGISFSQHNGATLTGVNVWQSRYGYQWYRSNRMRVIGCLSDYSRWHGFIIQESSDFQFDACQAREGSTETANTYDGFRVEGSPTIPCRDLSFMGCRAMGSVQRVGMGLINDIGRATIVGGSFAGNAVAAHVEGSGVIEWRYLAVGGMTDASG